MLQPFNYHAQLADLGVSMACNFTNMAMSCAVAVAAVAFAVPLALASSAQLAVTPEASPEHPGSGATSVEDRGEPSPYAAFRSGGGHASTTVVMGPARPR